MLLLPRYIYFLYFHLLKLFLVSCYSSKMRVWGQRVSVCCTDCKPPRGKLRFAMLGNRNNTDLTWHGSHPSQLYIFSAANWQMLACEDARHRWCKSRELHLLIITMLALQCKLNCFPWLDREHLSVNKLKYRGSIQIIRWLHYKTQEATIQGRKSTFELDGFVY